MRRRDLLMSVVPLAAGVAGLPGFSLFSARESYPRAAALDAAVGRYLSATGAPGGALAVVREGLLVHAAGYGDDGTGLAPSPRSQWRLASVTKPITASVVRELSALGQLPLEVRIVDLLGLRLERPDPRLDQVTMKHLIDHAGGWDSSVSGDPMFQLRRIAADLGVASPPGPEDIARHVLERPLDFAPGTRSAYSNFGYLLLGLAIERVSGRPYLETVERVLRARKIRGFSLGASLASARDEVRYTTAPGTALASSVFDSAPGAVPWPYGGFALEPMAAHGGLVSSVIDLAAYGRALDERLPSALPRPESNVIPTRPGHRYAYVQLGSLPGTIAVLRRDWDGHAFTVSAAAFNRRTGDGKRDSAISTELGAAIASITDWPAGTVL